MTGSSSVHSGADLWSESWASLNFSLQRSLQRLLLPVAAVTTAAGPHRAYWNLLGNATFSLQHWIWTLAWCSKMCSLLGKWYFFAYLWGLIPHWEALLPPGVGWQATLHNTVFFLFLAGGKFVSNGSLTAQGHQRNCQTCFITNGMSQGAMRAN